MQNNVVRLGLALALLASASHAAPSPTPANEFKCVTMKETQVVQTTLAGVPATIRIPTEIRKPPILLWHGFGPPASEGALMDALPLDDVPAVKVYLGLPLFGVRSPAPGEMTLVDPQTQNFASLIFEPIVMGGAKELPAVLQALRQSSCLAAKDKVGLFGFSAGGAASLYALAERDVPIGAAVTINAPAGLEANIKAVERATKQPHIWTESERQLADRTDFVRRRHEIAAGDPPPALMMIHGADDQMIGLNPTQTLGTTLEEAYKEANSAERLKLMVVEGVSHDWVGSPQHQRIETAIGDWFNKFL